MNKSPVPSFQTPPIRVAVVTPTFNRSRFLDHSHHCFTAQTAHAQNAPLLELHWFILDDSPEPHRADWCQNDPLVTYEWRPGRLALGHKRNLLNDRAAAWGAKTVCALDDDDWYGPTYVSSMHGLLATGHQLAGSSEDYLLELASGRVFRIPPLRNDTTCNGVLCFDTAILPGRRYDDTATIGEEPAFLRRDIVAQHPDVRSIHLGLAHPSNTATKKNYVRSTELLTDLTLDDFPMSEASKAFYRGLTGKP
ncbi:MAG: hypothetical protein EOO28_10480 [Comamonadaceae bacterium]|nr:MAG: hypothetical protein EOO28_10480 [Comamonadaceae bacterium]